MTLALFQDGGILLNCIDKVINQEIEGAMADAVYFNIFVKCCILLNPPEDVVASLKKYIKKEPSDSSAHELLSRAILRHARSEDLPATYAAQPAALHHLPHDRLPARR